MRQNESLGAPTPFDRRATATLDPSVIVLPRAQARPSDPAPADARERALARAGFRTHAENLMLAGLGALRDASFGDPKVADGEAGNMFDRQAERTRRSALDAARRTFGPVDTETDLATRRSLVAMTAEARQAGQRWRDEQTATAALDALESSASDIVDQVRSDPAAHDSYRAMLGSIVARYGDGLSAPARAAFHANVSREIDAARVQGLAEAGHFDAARQALANSRGSMPDGQAAALERSITRGEQAASLHAATTSAVTGAELGVRIARAEDVSQQMAAAERAGTLSPAETRRLHALQEEANARAAHLAGLAKLGAEAAHGTARLDPANADHRIAAELFWHTSLSPRLDQIEPFKRLDIEVATVARLGLVPKALQVRIIAGLTGADPGAAVLAADQVVGVLQQRPDMADQFAPGLVAVADHIWQASTAGASPADAVRFAHAVRVEHNLPRGSGADKQPTEPSVAAEAATAAGEKVADLAQEKPGHEATAPATIGGQFHVSLLAQLMQTPSADPDMHVERLAAIDRLSAETYLHRISSSNERLDPRHRDELGLKEIKAQQEAAVGWFEWLFTGR